MPANLPTQGYMTLKKNLEGTQSFVAKISLLENTALLSSFFLLFQLLVVVQPN